MPADKLHADVPPLPRAFVAKHEGGRSNQAARVDEATRQRLALQEKESQHASP